VSAIARYRRGWSTEFGRPATLLLIAAMLVSAGLILNFEREITFRLDEWTFLIGRPGFTADSILLPHNEHIVVGPVLTYKALIALFGTDSARPFQVFGVLTFLASVGLLFGWLRRRVGEWLALAGCVLILFCGAAGEDLLWPFQIGFFVGMAAGIGMLLALDRPSRRGDVAACFLLFFSLAWSSLGLSFVLAGALFLLLTGNPLRRSWVVAIPFALYVVWYARWGHYATNSLSFDNLLSSPTYVFDGFASSISSLLGLATPRDEAAVGALSWGRVLLLAALVGAGFRIWKIRSVPRTFWVVLALGVSFWFLAALNAGPDRPPNTGRYQYMGAIFVLMIAAELLRGVRPSRNAIIAVFGVSAVMLLSSVDYLRQLSDQGAQGGNVIRADLAAVEIARDMVDPDFIPDASFAGTGDVHIPAGLYLKMVDDSGSPAFSPAELASAPEYARAFADATLARAEQLALMPAGAAPAGSCRELDAGAQTVADLGPGRVVLEAAPGSSAQVRLRRFAEDSFPVALGKLDPGEPEQLTVPQDRSDVAWQLLVTGHGRVRAC
jgi:hypothetical protein